MARKGKDREASDASAAEDGWATQLYGAGPSARSIDDVAAKAPEAVRGRGRPWLIVLVSFAVQLVVVLAAGNTAVVGRVASYRNDGNLGAAFASLPGVYAWRVTPARGDVLHAYPAMLFGLLAFFVVAAVLVVALVRGPVTFWRAFVAVWLSTVVATLAGGMVRRGVAGDNGSYQAVGGKAVGVVFQGGGPEIVAGAVTGLLAALAAAIVAVKSRRPAQVVVPVPSSEPAPYVEPVAPPPWHGDDVRAPVAPRPAANDTDTSATMRFPAVAAVAAAASAGAGVAAAQRPADDSGATTRLRPSDADQYGPPTMVGHDRPSESQPAAPAGPVVETRREPAEAAHHTAEPPAESGPETTAPESIEQPNEAADPPAQPPVGPPTQPPAQPPVGPPAQPPVEQPTTRLPVQDRPRPAADHAAATRPDHTTQAFPRPPDDEDLGHHPDD